MKNKFLLAIPLMLILGASVFTGCEKEEGFFSPKDPGVFVTAGDNVFVYDDEACLNVPHTFTLNAPINTNLQVQVEFTSGVWTPVFQISKSTIDPTVFQYTFTSIGIYQLRYKAGTGGFTNGFYVTVSDCTPSCEVREESAFGGEYKGDGSAWWYYFDTEGDNTQPIFAGKDLTDGSVNWDGITLTIDLGSWTLQDDDEAVKVQGYNTLPESRPSAGQFTLYKGTSLTVAGDGSRYYVIHLDVEICE